MQTAIVQVSVEVSVEIGRIGDSHALVDSTIYAPPVTPGTAFTVLKQRRQLVEIKDVDQTVQQIVKDPMAVVASRDWPEHKYGYVIPGEHDMEYRGIHHARIENNVAVDHKGNPLMPEFVIIDGLFSTMAVSLAGNIPLPDKVILDEYMCFQDEVQLNEEWIDLPAAVAALNKIPGVVAEITEDPEQGPDALQGLQIVVDTATHRATIEAAVHAYHDMYNDDTVVSVDRQDRYSIVFHSIISPAIAPFIIKSNSQ